MTLHPVGRHLRRVAFYSHDTQGLGHVRRNIALAAALVQARPATDVLLLTGSPEATALPLPPSTDVLTLPTLHKHPDGRYSPRVLSAPLHEVLDLQATLVDAALSAFDPDLLVVDKVARGVHGCLDRALLSLRRRGRARTVLGLRDVLDAPAIARREWDDTGTSEAVRDLYDEVWVYGDRDVYDCVREYDLPSWVAEKVVYTGYLAGPRPPALTVRHRVAERAAPPEQPYALCLVGGGQDGADLARAFVRAALPPGLHGVVLTGPYMPAEQRRDLLRHAASRRDVTVHEFVATPHLFVQRAAVAVSMAGYNSVCELLAAGCPTLLVPRVRPRLEQAVRAARLAATGHVDVLEHATASNLSAWLSAAVARTARARTPLRRDGLVRVPVLARRLLDDLVPAGREAAHVVA